MRRRRRRKPRPPRPEQRRASAPASSYPCQETAIETPAGPEPAGNGNEAMRRKIMKGGAIAGLLTLAAGAALHAAHAADPDALWKIVHGRCVPDQQANGKPAPCVSVSLQGGE